MIYGYVRVSTDKQDCENQKMGIESKAKQLNIVIDKYIEDNGVSGTKAPEKRALGGILKKLKQGDIIICSELSRLSRTVFTIMSILKHCMDTGAKVYTVKDGYELGDNIQSKVLAFAFGLSAEIERDLISQRTREALARIKASGRKLGKPFGSKNKTHKLDNKSGVIKQMMDEGQPIRRIAKKLNVCAATIFRYIFSEYFYDNYFDNIKYIPVTNSTVATKLKNKIDMVSFLKTQFSLKYQDIEKVLKEKIYSIKDIADLANYELKDIIRDYNCDTIIMRCREHEQANK